MWPASTASGLIMVKVRSNAMLLLLEAFSRQLSALRTAAEAYCSC
jgi:hypothetical protein